MAEVFTNALKRSVGVVTTSSSGSIGANATTITGISTAGVAVGYLVDNGNFIGGAKVSVIVSNGSSITGFTLEDPGYGYKVGEVLKVVGITTNPSVGVGFSEFRITVLETFTDKFGGFYPGQFVRINSLAPFFTGKKRKFLLTVTTFGITDTFSIRTIPGSDLNISNNFFIFWAAKTN